jgi:hypothetical protein
VASTVAAAYITSKVVDDQMAPILKAKEDDAKALRDRGREDLKRLALLEEAAKTDHYVLEKCKEERAEKILKLAACKSDFRHAGLFRKVETFPELPENKGVAS